MIDLQLGALLYFKAIVIVYYAVIIPLSYLPLWVLYRISDVAFHLIYYLFRYRRKVVLGNLRNSFPEKSQVEIEAIARGFFSHFCDIIFESIKGCTISQEEILLRHSYTNIELLESYYQKGKPVTILGSHYGNWEWVALSLPLVTRFQTYGIYQTLTNPFMNKIIKRSRQRNGMRLIPKGEVSATLRENRDKKITMGYIGDQSPSRNGRHYWVKFLNQETAAASGFEYFAKEYDAPVVYLNIVKKRRGFYEGTFSLIADEPKKTQVGQIVEAYMKTLESIIRENPEYWLWSHRRWKIKKP